MEKSGFKREAVNSAKSPEQSWKKKGDIVHMIAQRKSHWQLSQAQFLETYRKKAES